MKFFNLRRPDDGTVPLGQFTSVVTRRHPVSVASYVFTFIFGAIFLLGLTATGKSIDQLFPHVATWVVWAWEAELTFGSLLALVALVMPLNPTRNWPDLGDLLHFEALGALVSGLGLVTYLVAETRLLGGTQVLPTLAIFTPLIVGRFWRAVQAFGESQRLTRLALLTSVYAEGAIGEAESVHVYDGGIGDE